MKFKPGTKVIVTPDLIEKERNNELYVNTNAAMHKYIGKVVTIDFAEKATYTTFYNIKEDKLWTWCENCFIPIIENKDEAFNLFVRGEINETTYKSIVESVV